MTSGQMNPIRWGVRGIDWLLRRNYQVEEYSDHPDCMLRVSPVNSDVEITLSDGTQIKEGDPLIDLHLWNERLASHVLALDDLARGRALLRYLRTSLRLLNTWIINQSGSGDFIAVRAESGMFTDLHQAEAILERMGFDVVLKEKPGFRFWRRAFWDNLFSMALMWTFNPGFARTRRLGDLVRGRLWMSLAKLQQHYSQ